jgi:flagellar protein FlgJ
MTVKPVAARPASPTPPDKDGALRKTAGQLEGVFVEQLYKAMRATVPQDGTFGGGSGEEMFTGLLDEHLAAETPREWRHGLGEALYHQLRGPASEPAASPADQQHTPAPVAATPATAGDDGR